MYKSRVSAVQAEGGKRRRGDLPGQISLDRFEEGSVADASIYQ